MMRPQPRAFISGTTAWIRWKAADRLIARIASQRSAGNDSTGATCWMPALLTMMSTRPNACRASSAIARMADGSPMSAAL